jgi:AcrR family transcriptional regulator
MGMAMPKLWNDTIAAHRMAVRDAALDTTAELAATHGIPAVTMSLIAKETGIGRATLYKYFPDVETILFAWHERQIARHLAHIEKVAEGVSDPVARLTTVLEAYACIVHEHHGTGFSAALHRRPRAKQAEHTLHRFVSTLIAQATAAGEVRADIPADELAHFALAGLAAASQLPTKAAVNRLVLLILSGLRAS